MSHLKQVQLASILNHMVKGAGRAIAAEATERQVWQTCTPVADAKVEIVKSKFFKSISDDIDDASKRANFSHILLGLYAACKCEKFTDYFSNTNIACKEAHSFKFNSHNIKIYELKVTRKKERLYFYYGDINNAKTCILLQGHHKRDETTPSNIKNYCESTIRIFLR